MIANDFTQTMFCIASNRDTFILQVGPNSTARFIMRSIVATPAINLLFLAKLSDLFIMKKIVQKVTINLYGTNLRYGYTFSAVYIWQ